MNDAKLIWKLEKQLGDARRELAQLETETLELTRALKKYTNGGFYSIVITALDQPAISKLMEAKDDT